jgi:hypothetical protein
MANPSQWIAEKLYMGCRRLYLRVHLAILRKNAVEISLRLLMILINLAILAYYIFALLSPPTTHKNTKIGLFCIIAVFSITAIYKIVNASIYRVVNAYQRGICTLNAVWIASGLLECLTALVCIYFSIIKTMKMQPYILMACTLLNQAHLYREGAVIIVSIITSIFEVIIRLITCKLRCRNVEIKKGVARGHPKPFRAKMYETKICSICLEEFTPKSTISILNCSHKHIFHSECIEAWLSIISTCPLCKRQASIV